MSSSTARPKQTAPTRDAEATKTRILDAAEEEFARGGLLGARTESIAANTGVTKAMLYYYYGDKEGLYRAVLERAVVERIKSLQHVDVHSDDHLEALRQYACALLDDSGRNQNLPPIFFYEGIQNKGEYYGQIAMASVYDPLVGILERGIAAGTFRETDPLHAAVNIIGTCVFYYCSFENVKHLWPAGTDLRSDDMRARHKACAVEQIIAGVKK